VQIVGVIPKVAEARKQGFCPRFEASYVDRVDKLDVQARYGCGPSAGTLISNYSLDLRAGIAFEQENAINNSTVEALADVLLEQARNGRLTIEESRCRAVEAAKSLPGWGGPGREVSIEQSGAFGIRFEARLRSLDPPMVTQRFLMVDRTTARVHDNETGMEV